MTIIFFVVAVIIITIGLMVAWHNGYIITGQSSSNVPPP